MTSCAVRSVPGVVVLCLGVGLPSASGQTAAEQLATAAKLFEAGEYVRAQEALLKVSVAELSDDVVPRRHRLVDRVKVAINLSQKAASDKGDADTAIQAGRFDDAEADYTLVLENPYAGAALKKAAERGRRQVAEKRRLAAKVSGGAGAGQDRMAQAKQAKARGDSAAAAGNFETAVKHYRQATTLAPTLLAAQQKLGDALAHVVAKGGGPVGLVDQISTRDRILWQRAESTVQKEERETRQAIVDSNFEAAKAHAIRASQELEAGRQYARPLSRYEDIRQRINDLARYVDDEGRRYEGAQRRIAIERARELAKQRREQMSGERANQISQLMEQMSQYKRERRFDEAIEVANEVLAIDPTNDDARNRLLGFAEQRSMREQIDIAKTTERENLDVLNETARSRIPWHQTMLYPRNWPQITERRKRYNVGQINESDANRATRQQLNLPLAELELDEISFENVITHLRETTGLNLHVNWRAMEAAGIEREAPVTLDLRAIKLDKALKVILDDVSGGEVPLGFMIDEGVVQVSTEDDLSRKAYVIAYDIQDLLIPTPNFRPALDLGLQGLFGGGGGGGGGGGLGGGLGGGGGGGLGGGLGGGGGGGLGGGGLGGGGGFGGGGGGAGGADDDTTREDLVEDILELLRETINPDTWRENGGDIGAIQELNGQLIITQTAEAHAQMLDLLQRHREARRLARSAAAREALKSSLWQSNYGVDPRIALKYGNAVFDERLNPQVGVFAEPDAGATIRLPLHLSRMGFVPALQSLGTPLLPGAAPVRLVSPADPVLPRSPATSLTPIKLRAPTRTTTPVTGAPCSLDLSVAISPLLHSGSIQTQPEVSPFERPGAPPELQKVKGWLGTWDSSAEVVSPSPKGPRRMRSAQPIGPQATTKGQSTIEWDLGGVFLKERGWYETPDGQRVHFVAYLTWDPRSKQYRAWKFNDWGQQGEEWLRFDRDGTMHTKTKSTDAQGHTSRGTGRYVFTDDNVIEWTRTQRGPTGRVTMKGTMKRRRQAKADEQVSVH